MLLRVTGGYAKAEKSVGCLMNQVFNNEKWGVAKPEMTEMEIEGDEGIPLGIKSLPLDKEKKVLGVYDSPEGGNKTQMKMKKAKVESFVHRERSGKLPAYLGWGL